MNRFYQIAINCFISVVVTNVAWFAMSLWVFTQTNSVLATSIMSGVYLVAVAVTGIWFGALVDHHRKKTMLMSSYLVTLLAFILAFVWYVVAPENAFKYHFSFHLWVFIGLIFIGVIAASIRNITLPTIVGLVVPEAQRDKANGITGTMTGLSFLIASIVSGFLLAASGMFWILLGGIGLLVVALFHLLILEIPEKEIVKVEGAPTVQFDFVETFGVVKKIPGLFGLILFTSLNNFLGGVFMPLLDPYGLSLVSLEVWGLLWGVLSLGFIVGGMLIAKRGLGSNPLRTLFVTNIFLWTISIFFAVQPWIVLLSIGLFLYLTFVPFVEASEQTIIQKIVPKERQGRVFGFAQSLESSASPLTAFAIGPIAQYFFIPFMTNGLGAQWIGGWFGVGAGRGIGLLFTVTGFIGLAITLLAMNSRTYQLLSKTYQNK